MNYSHLNIPKNLKEIRTKLGLTQHEVAELAGLKFVQMYQKHEAGVAVVSVKTLVKYCTALNATPDDLLAP